MAKEVKPRRILFVCTGNIFRSLSAKYALQDYIKKKGIKDIIVNSAGTIAEKEPINPVIVDELKSLGIDVSNHKQKRLDKQDLKNNDLIVAMAQSHVDFINNNFNFYKVFLFNEILTGKKESVKDVDEVFSNWRAHKVKAEKYIRKTVRYIYKSIPKFYKNIDKYTVKNL
jgi:protein-tyrosine-phosphatase